MILTLSHLAAPSKEAAAIITAKTIVLSKKFDALLQKKTVRKLLPSHTDTQLQEIDDEIDAGIEEEEQQKKNMDFNPFDELNLNKNGNNNDQNANPEDDED